MLTLSPTDLAGDDALPLDMGLIPAETARRLTGDASLTTVAVDSRGRLVGVGRRTRVVPPALRRTLAQRDGGCAHPGCDVPVRWCDAHHIQHWAQGGATPWKTCSCYAAATIGWSTRASRIRGDSRGT